MFDSGFPCHFKKNIFTLPCWLGQIPDLSASTVLDDAWNSDAKKLPPRMARKGWGWRWELKRQDPPGAQPGPAETGTEPRKWENPAQPLGPGPLTALLSRRLSGPCHHWDSATCCLGFQHSLLSNELPLLRPRCHSFLCCTDFVSYNWSSPLAPLSSHYLNAHESFLLPVPWIDWWIISLSPQLILRKRIGFQQLNLFWGKVLFHPNSEVTGWHMD